MARAPAEVERLQAITHTLQSVRSSRQPVLPEILPDLRHLLGAESACAYSVKVGAGRCEPEFVYGDGVAAQFTDVAREWFRDAPVPWGLFDPSRPAPAQRNAVVTISELPFDPDKPAPAVTALFPKVGLANKDQIRVLVCEEDSLLAWVGAFRDEPFTRRERSLLTQLVEPLRERLTLERRLQTSNLHVAALQTTLEHLGTAAFILGPSAQVVEANTAGRALLAGQRELHEILAAAQRGEPTEYTLTRITEAGLGEHHLAVRRPTRPDARESAALAGKRWRLTPRQTEVLALLAEGLSNRAISARLGCSESTVEIHVSAILAKADVDGRAALVARVWTQS